MNDKILQTEIILEGINILFAKSIAFKDEKMMRKLNILRHRIYYRKFDYYSMMNELIKASQKLKQYDCI